MRRETPSVVTLVLADAGSFDFGPGQFFTLVTDIDGRSERRAYSASSAPGTSRLEITVKLVEGGRFPPTCTGVCAPEIASRCAVPRAPSTWNRARSSWWPGAAA